MVKIKIAPNGNLLMSVEGETLKAVKRMRDKQTKKAEKRFVRLFLSHVGVTTVEPEEVGALTDGTIIKLGDKFWWDANYQVKSMLETLANGEEVKFYLA